MRNFLLLICGILIVMTACQNDPMKGYSTTASGHLYKIHIDKEGPTATEGQKATVNLTVRKKDANGQDSIITSSLRDRQKGDEVVIPPAANMGGSPLFEGILLMSEGDSMTVAVAVDSMPQIPPGFKSGDFVYFDIAIHGLMSKEETEAEQKELMAKQQAEALEAQAKADSVTTMIKARIVDYKAGKLDKDIKSIDVEGAKLKYIIHNPGTGTKAEANKTVDVHYAGHLLNGDEFDASFKRGTPISFPLGQGRVIKGWDKGIELMNDGGAATLFIPYELAYGEAGRPPSIPAKAELVFYVELKGVR